MIDFSGPYYGTNDSPFCPATGKMLRFCKGGSSAAPQIVAAANAAEIPSLVGQAADDSEEKRAAMRGRNKSIIGASYDTAFGNKLKLGS